MAGSCCTLLSSQSLGLPRPFSAHLGPGNHAAKPHAAHSAFPAVPQRCEAQGKLPALPRREALAAPLLAAIGVLGQAAPARAGLVDGLVRQLVRPDVDLRAALVTLMDARGALYQLRGCAWPDHLTWQEPRQELAATSPDSRERFLARRDLPALAKRLREVGTAAPVLAALAGGGDREATVSALYGGSGGADSAASAVYAAIGNVVTISGRTIRPEAQASPAAAQAAIQHIDELLAILPREEVAAAAALRAARRAPASA